MAQQLRELMTTDPIRLESSTPIVEAARQMRDADVGSVIVEENGKPCGIVTDRDIAVRAVAEHLDPEATPLSEVCSKDLATLTADAEVARAVQIMRDKAIRRVLVVDKQDHAIGIVSLGDLAVERDPRSALGAISAAPANH